MGKLKILMLTYYFPPEVGSASHLFAELGAEFARRKHEVTVLTGFPRYNVDQETLPHRYRKGVFIKEEVQGMRVLRTRTLGMPRTVPVLRGMDQVMGSIFFGFSGIFRTSGRPDVVLVYSPPLFLGLTGLLLRLFKRPAVYLNVQDLFPQSAIDLGLLRSPFLARMFRSVESFLYKSVDGVTVHSPGNASHVLKSGGVPTRTHVVPNVVDTHATIPGERVNSFRKKWNIPNDEFVVSFAGVLGYSQDIDTILEAASLLQERSRIKIYIVGDGVEKPRLLGKAQGMANVRFLPMLPKEEYAELLQASDVCLATLRKEVQTPVVPSKILSIMAAQRPVVAALPLGGDAPALIREAQCGLCVEAGDGPALAHAVRSMEEDHNLARKFGVNGRRYVDQNLSVEACADAYEKLFGESRAHSHGKG